MPAGPLQTARTPKSTPARVAEIRGHLVDLDRQGVPIPHFARKIGVAPWTVRSWLRRFGPARPNSKGSAPIADLVEVVPAVGASAPIEIVVGAVTIRLGDGDDRPLTLFPLLNIALADAAIVSWD